MMSMDRLRCKDGERRGWHGWESVYLGGISRLDGGMRWYVLTNVHAEPEHNFAVDGAEVRDVLDLMKRQGVSPHVLWHSHSDQDGPSDMDVQSLPHWIAVGVVWSAASTVSTSYDRAGVISSTNGTPTDVTADISTPEDEFADWVHNVPLIKE